MEINITNENLSADLSLILNEIAELISENKKEANIVKNITCINNTKGEILTGILITLGTTITSDVIVFFITEAIKRHWDKHKKKIQIIKEKKTDLDYLEIKLEYNDSEIIVKIEE